MSATTAFCPRGGAYYTILLLLAMAVGADIARDAIEERKELQLYPPDFIPQKNLERMESWGANFKTKNATLNSLLLL